MSTEQITKQPTQEQETEFEPKPENPGICFALLPIPAIIALTGILLVLGALLCRFAGLDFGMEWLHQWVQTLQGVLGALITGFFLVTTAALLAGFIGRMGMSPDLKPGKLMNAMLGIGDTAISMGIISAAALLLTCRRPITSQFAPDVMMGYIDRPEGMVVRGVTGGIFLILSIALILLLMRIRNQWENADFAERRERNKVARAATERYHVVLEYVPIEKKPQIIRMLRQYIGVDSATAKGLVGAVPVRVLTHVSADDAETLVEFLLQEDARAHVEEDLA